MVMPVQYTLSHTGLEDGRFVVMRRGRYPKLELRGRVRA